MKWNELESDICMDLQNKPDIVKVIAILENGTGLALSQKADRNHPSGLSQSLFLDTIPGNPFVPFKVMLRFDFGNDGLDVRSDPTLDAEIWEPNGKRWKKYTAGAHLWHHTCKKLADNEWMYKFEFN